MRHLRWPHLVAVVTAVCMLVSVQTALPGQLAALKIIVIAGEDAVNIIQQRTAVAPIIEVRDRNNLPVAGASVTFALSGSGASFGTGSTLTVVIEIDEH